jgi:hypothetical protein
MNSPPTLLRLVEVFVRGFFNCVRFLTAPLRALSPTGLFTAIVASRLSDNARAKTFVPAGELEAAFLGGFLHLVLGLFLLLDGSHLLSALLVGGLLLATLANNILALVIRHLNLLVAKTTSRERLGSSHADAAAVLRVGSHDNKLIFEAEVLKGVAAYLCRWQGAAAAPSRPAVPL